MLTAPWVDQRCVSLLSSLSTELSSVLLPGACVPTVRRVDASRLSSSTSVDLSRGFPCFCPVIRPWTLSLLHAGGVWLPRWFLDLPGGQRGKGSAGPRQCRCSCAL